MVKQERGWILTEGRQVQKRQYGGDVSYSTVTVALKVFSGATVSHGRT